MSLISLIYVNKSDDIICHGTLHKIADHDGVLVSSNIYDHKNVDIDGLVKYV